MLHNQVIGRITTKCKDRQQWRSLNLFTVFTEDYIDCLLTKPRNSKIRDAYSLMKLLVRWSRWRKRYAFPVHQIELLDNVLNEMDDDLENRLSTITLNIPDNLNERNRWYLHKDKLE